MNKRTAGWLAVAAIVGASVFELFMFERGNFGNRAFAPVTGRIWDHATRKPIVGAKVTAISGKPLQFRVDRDVAFTNAQGEYMVKTVPGRDGGFDIRADGYMTLYITAQPRKQLDVPMVRATAKAKDLATARIQVPPGEHLHDLRLDLERGKIVERGDYDVEIRLETTGDSTLVAAAGPGRSVRIVPRGKWVAPWNSFPENMRFAPDSGYAEAAQVPARSEQVLLFVRRDSGPRYGAIDLFPRALFPPPGRNRYAQFDIVFNRAGGRGFCGAAQPIFQ